ncbi:MAG: AAA family ATPase [Methylophilaceae bacterium]
MKHILVINPKGGSGKTTLSTNLAGYFAAQGNSVTLADLDRQQSSIDWLKRRPKDLPKIKALDARRQELSDKPDWLITDAPAGIRNEKLTEAIQQADWVIVPIQPSILDMCATRDFLAVLEEEKAIRKQKTAVAVVGMRMSTHTRSSASLLEFLQETGLPMPACLRNAQTYVTAAEQGMSLFDMRPSQVKVDLQQWRPLLDWIQNTH